MTRRKLTGAERLLPLAAAAIVAGGCGGTSQGSKGSAAARADQGAQKASFIAQADALCERVNRAVAAAGAGRPAESPSRTAYAHAAAERAAVAELSKLTPPPALRSQWQEILGYRRTLAQELQQYATDVRSAAGSGTQALEREKTSTHRYLREAGMRAGFEACSTVGV